MSLSYKETLELRNQIVEEWYNSGEITEGEKNELLVKLQEDSNPDVYLDVGAAITNNETSFGLYDRDQNYLSKKILDDDVNFCYIKSASNKYLKYNDNGDGNDGTLELESMDIDSNKDDFTFQIHKNNTNFVRFSNKNGGFLNVNSNYLINFPVVTKNQEDKKTNSNHIKLTYIADEDKYYIESVKFKFYKLESNYPIKFNKGTSANHKWTLEPILLEEQIKHKNMIFHYVKKIKDIIPEKIKLNKTLKYNTEDTFKTNIIEPLQQLNSNIETDLKNKIIEYQEKDKQNNLLLTNFNKNKNDYNNTKEHLNNLNENNSILEDNVYLLNEAFKYNNLKSNTLYTIKLLLIVISTLLFLSVLSIIFKRM